MKFLQKLKTFILGQDPAPCRIRFTDEHNKQYEISGNLTKYTNGESLEEFKHSQYLKDFLYVSYGKKVKSIDEFIVVFPVN